MPEFLRRRIGLRPATLEDREYLWWLHRETMRDYIDKTWGWNEAFQRGLFDENFDPLPLRIIEKESEPIGCISVRRSGDEIFLAAIEIAPARQNLGVASQLIQELLDEADRSHRPVTLQ